MVKLLLQLMSGKSKFLKLHILLKLSRAHYVHEVQTIVCYCREIGSDIQQGTVVLGALAKLTSSQIGLLASVGMFKVPVLR